MFNRLLNYLRLTEIDRSDIAYTKSWDIITGYYRQFPLGVTGHTSTPSLSTLSFHSVAIARLIGVLRVSLV